MYNSGSFGILISKYCDLGHISDCVNGVDPSTILTSSDHTVEPHPRSDETPVGIGEILLKKYDMPHCRTLHYKIVFKNNYNNVLIDHICWKYSIGKKFGEGECSSIFEGTCGEDHLQVAVKFTAELENKPAVHQPCEQTALSVSRLSSPLSHSLQFLPLLM